MDLIGKMHGFNSISLSILHDYDIPVTLVSTVDDCPKEWAGSALLD